MAVANAHYARKNLPEQYWGNPLIECLPEIKAPKEVLTALLRMPDVALASSRLLPSYIRLHEIAMVKQVFIPREEWIHFESELGILLRQGLKGRNPFDPKTQKNLYLLKEQVEQELKAPRHYEDPFAGSILVTALSGSGKTRGIRENLSMYPQVIQHDVYQGTPFVQKQVVWMSVEAPINGSIKGLLHRLFIELDKVLGNVGHARYAEMYKAQSIAWDTQVKNFSQAAASHFLGVLHIDDLQRLLEADVKQQHRIFGFIVQLANVAKIPLILSGTHSMIKLLARSFESSRRATAAGFVNLRHAESETDAFFTNLVNALFKYQWVDEPLALDDKVFASLHKWTMGLPFMVIGVFCYGQKIALRSGSKKFTLEHMESAYNGPYKILHPALHALRSGDAESLQRFEDLLPSEEQMQQVFLEYDRKFLKDSTNDSIKNFLDRAI